jgi:hypothetical protein
MTSLNTCLATVVLLSVSASGQTPPSLPNLNGAELHVRLLAPLTTKLNRKGDMVSAKVIEPAAMKDAILEGEIHEIHAGGASNKRSTIQFRFHTLHVSGSGYPLSAGLLRIGNSSHRTGMDEDGTVIEDDAPENKPASHSVLGLHRGQTDKKPSSLIKLAARGPNLSLAVGSELTLQVQSSEP